MAGADGLVVGIEQKAECRVKYPIARTVRDQHELLEEPGCVRPVPLRRAGVGHRLQGLVLVTERNDQALGNVPDGPEPGGQIIRGKVCLRKFNAMHICPPDRQ
jgi:hypothetical protein